MGKMGKNQFQKHVNLPDGIRREKDGRKKILKIATRKADRKTSGSQLIVR